MIGSWFPQPQSTSGAWAWEAVAADGSTVAVGVSADEQAAGWDCREAMFQARLDAPARNADIALLPATVRFGGRWAGAVAG